MSVKLLNDHYLEILSLKGGCTGSSESRLVKMSNCWKSHAAAQLWYSPKKSKYPLYIVIGVLQIMTIEQNTALKRLKGYTKVSDRLAATKCGAKLHLFCYVLLDFSLTVKAAPHECVIRTSQP